MESPGCIFPKSILCRRKSKFFHHSKTFFKTKLCLEPYSSKNNHTNATLQKLTTKYFNKNYFNCM
jgi:hypothetical protein